MIKLIAFDWNGTLLDDTEAGVDSDNIALKNLGLPTITISQFRKCFDVPIINYWKNLGMTENFFKNHMYLIEKDFQINYEKMADKARTRTGTKELLKWLKNNKIKSIIYSNHTTPNIQRQLKRLKINVYFEKVLARPLKDISHLHNRGKEQKLLGYIKNRKLKPHEVISVGDTEEEIEIGKAQGYYTVALTGGYNTTARLKKHNPDFLINNLKELPKIIKKLNG